MKVILFIFFFSISSSILAQESIGFSDSTDFKYLIDYRLPNWGYSNFYFSNVGVGINGTIENVNRDRNLSSSNSPQTNKSESNQYNLGFGIAPAYDYFRESEDLNIKVNTSLSFSANRRNNKQENEDDNSGVINTNNVNTKRGSERIDFEINTETQHFVSSDFFLEANWRSNLRYDFYSSSENRNQLPETTQSSKNRFIYLNPSAGVGFGRIRNVTPIIRALRLNERYKALGNSSLTKQDIEFSSTQFTRYQGYQRNYDRPQKYFWNDLDNGIDRKLSDLNAFDMFYLNDVFNENIGSRFEGYSIALTGGYSYLNSLSKIDFHGSDPNRRNFAILRTANVELDAVWYKNLNLNHQISANLLNQLYFPLEKKNSVEVSYSSQFDSDWLWILADRFQLNNRLRLRYNRDRIKDIESFKEYYLFTNVSSQLSYFVENKLILSASLGLNQRLQSRDITLSNNLFDENYSRSTWDISFSISLRYYINRNLY